MATSLLSSSCHRIISPKFILPNLKFLSRRIACFSQPNCQAVLGSPTMQSPIDMPEKEFPVGIDATVVDAYSSQAILLQEFANVPSVNNAWIFKSETENSSRAMFSFGQPNFLTDKKRTFIHYSNISKSKEHSVNFQWSPFPVEMNGVSTVVPSPSGLKLLVVRNKDTESPTQLEIWSSCQLEKEIHVSQSVHGSIYTDGWFEGISWNDDENLIAYVAEEPAPLKPAFNDLGYKKAGPADKDFNSWRGQGDWEEDWGETYSKKRKPSLFVVDISSGEAYAVVGVPKSLSAGQVVWAPSTSNGSTNYLVFVGWVAENGPQQTQRKLGIKYCYNRPCALYAIKVPRSKSNNADEDKCDASAVKLTQSLSSAFFPRFSPDGNTLVFMSARSAVDSGAHWATESLHKMNWPTYHIPEKNAKIIDVVHIVMCPKEDGFPGLYCTSLLPHPWLSDGCTMIMSSIWGSTQAIIAVNISSCEVLQISPTNTIYSWNVLALDQNNILAVSSSPLDPPQLKYAFHEKPAKWDWKDISSPLQKNSNKVKSLLSSHQCTILKIPVNNPSDSLPEGARKPFEAIFIRCKKEESDGVSSTPTILMLHGGPHSVTLSSYSKASAFLTSLGYNLLIVNYRGSLGFGEEALQSLPGHIGSQDVNDVLSALDHVIEKGLVNPSKVAVTGGSHGGFLTTHLIGQAPDRFVAAAARNPVCNLALMVGTSDIPDWCYIETYGTEGRNIFSEAPSAEDLNVFYNKSPISHLSKVKTPTIFLLGAQDLRVPVSNGLQYARALKEKGVEVKVIVFADDCHGLERPRSDYESFLNIGVGFRSTVSEASLANHVISSRHT